MAQKPSSASNEAKFKPLFESALKGDKKAYAALLSNVAELAKKYAMRKTGGHADCDDIAQEILVSVHKALHTYDPARPCMPWLAAIMHYRMSDWLRSRYTAANQPKVPIEDVEHFLTDDVTIEPLAYEYVNKAVAGLTQGQQAVITSMYGEELTVVETSEKLGMSVSAVKVTAHRAYKKLRERLDDE